MGCLGALGDRSGAPSRGDIGGEAIVCFNIRGCGEFIGGWRGLMGKPGLKRGGDITLRWVDASELAGLSMALSEFVAGGIRGEAGRPSGGLTIVALLAWAGLKVSLSLVTSDDGLLLLLLLLFFFDRLLSSNSC